jgi:glycosyltransferase involved in cell wall biosynthesis
MRVLYHHRIRADDGQAVHVRELITALRALGHDVREVALVPKTGVGSAPVPRRSFWQRLRLPRWLLERLEIAYSARGARMLIDAGREFRPDFVYERHALHCAAGLDAARALGVPLLLEVNSPMCDEMEALGALYFRRRARRTERRVLAGADAVLAVSHVLRQRLIECGAEPTRCHVIRNAADPSRFAPAAAGRDARRQSFGAGAAVVLGFVGHARRWHRLDLLVDALAQPELAGAHLVLAGDGPAIPVELARARAAGLGERVHALGHVAAAELPSVVGAFDVAVIPAINGYASPLKLFDSLAAGIATVAPDQSNLRETIEDGVSGLLFEPGNPAALARALARLVHDAGLRARIGATGRARLLAEDWTWAGNARRVVACFEALRG